MTRPIPTRIVAVLATLAHLTFAQTATPKLPGENRLSEQAAIVAVNRNLLPQETQELRCRGGEDGNGYLGFYFETIGSRTSAAGEIILTIAMRFSLTSSVTDQERGNDGRVLSEPHWVLPPGGCTWLGLANEPYESLGRLEPREIRFETPANAQLKRQLQGTPLDTSATAAERFPDAQTIPAYLKNFNHYWKFIVFNSNRGFFQATGHTFWKPPAPKPQLVQSDSINLKNPTPYLPDRPADLKALATRGADIADKDPMVAELRSRQADGSTRRGFDIGLAASEGQTLAGPNKQRIHQSLSAAEQQGFDIAVTFSLERNQNAELAATGAAIATRDSVVAEARMLEPDVFYWLGFDIASGIFGDPALGARGNTATGPGSLKIRDSLNAAGQRGFNAAVKLHLSRNYKH